MMTDCCWVTFTLFRTALCRRCSFKRTQSAPELKDTTLGFCSWKQWDLISINDKEGIFFTIANLFVIFDIWNYLRILHIGTWSCWTWSTSPLRDISNHCTHCESVLLCSLFQFYQSRPSNGDPRPWLRGSSLCLRVNRRSVCVCVSLPLPLPLPRRPAAGKTPECTRGNGRIIGLLLMLLYGFRYYSKTRCCESTAFPVARPRLKAARCDMQREAICTVAEREKKMTIKKTVWITPPQKDTYCLHRILKASGCN